MELITFFIWLIIVFLTSWILFSIILKNTKDRNKKAITWALIFALFASLIYGLIVYPFVTYQNCNSGGIVATVLFGGGTTACNKVLSFSLFFTYGAIFLTLLALLLTTTV